MAIEYNDIEFRKKVWERGVPVEEYDPQIIRKDAAGAWIIFDRYKKDDPFGWEIDHVFPRKLLAEQQIDEALWDNIQNLRPMNFANKKSKGTSYPNYIVRMKSDGDSNVECEESFTVNQELQEALGHLFGLL